MESAQLDLLGMQASSANRVMCIKGAPYGEELGSMMIDGEVLMEMP